MLNCDSINLGVNAVNPLTSRAVNKHNILNIISSTTVNRLHVILQIQKIFIIFFREMRIIFYSTYLRQSVKCTWGEVVLSKVFSRRCALTF